MAGKSTYMRQNALIALMARSAPLCTRSQLIMGVVDAIFTRIGASDDLLQVESTFMVEMTEVARNSEKRHRQSLVVLDEIGAAHPPLTA